MANHLFTHDFIDAFGQLAHAALAGIVFDEVFAPGRREFQGEIHRKVLHGLGNQVAAHDFLLFFCEITFHFYQFHAI